MDLCIDNGPMVVILKTAYDESYKNVSPSTLMRQTEFEQWWVDKRYEQIEFYGKTLEWHTRWTDTSKMLFHVNAYRWSAVRALHDRLRARAKAAVETSTAAPAAPAAPAQAVAVAGEPAA
jgi:hypothetical protein